MKNRKNVYADEVRGKERAGGACARMSVLTVFACAYLVMNVSLLFRGRGE